MRVRPLQDELTALDREPLVGASGVRVSARRAAAVDRALRARFGPVPTLALVAVGGYGRSELAPGSDLDLLVLHHPGEHARAEESFGPILYDLWDLGLTVGHAVRTPEECRDEAEQRFESLTTVLDARLVAGDSTLVREALAAVRDLVRNDPARLLDELRASMVQREARFGSLGESPQPDLRDSVGGLRDVQGFGWLARGLGVDPVDRGWVRPGEAESVGSAWEFLLRTRTALHRLVGRRSDVLMAEHHDPVAASLGVGGQPAPSPVVWEPRDVFMRRLFLHGRAVRAAAEEALGRAAADLEDRPQHTVAVGWRPDPLEGVMAAFGRLAAEGGSLDPQDLERVEGSEWPVASWTSSVREAFIRVLSGGEGGARALGTMDRTGVLEGLLPEWDAVRGRPQRDPFHRFPADTHLIRAAAQLARLLFRPDEPATAASVAAIADPAPLLIAALLHDIGKVGAG
ncbi:MAG TPA: nucleotidyltransferase domain-containing protein, partial [Actinomycetota bacterium]|nr:nucleotidyltransferase domain-containing protein [Actinomycetota bacterium]